MNEHRVATIDFTGARRMGLPGEDAAMQCYCGWEGQAGDFAAHRLEMKASQGIRSGPDKVIPWSIKGGQHEH